MGCFCSIADVNLSLSRLSSTISIVKRKCTVFSLARALVSPWCPILTLFFVLLRFSCALSFERSLRHPCSHIPSLACFLRSVLSTSRKRMERQQTGSMLWKDMQVMTTFLMSIPFKGFQHKWRESASKRSTMKEERRRSKEIHIPGIGAQLSSPAVQCILLAHFWRRATTSEWPCCLAQSKAVLQNCGWI